MDNQSQYCSWAIKTILGEKLPISKFLKIEKKGCKGRAMISHILSNRGHGHHKCQSSRQKVVSLSLYNGLMDTHIE